MIQAMNLSKAFGSERVLDDVGLSINDGELVYLIGQSGEGKTVLGRCLFGLLPPDGGSVRIDDFELVGANPRALHHVRMHYVYVFQHPTLFDAFSVEENIALPLRYHRAGTPAEIQRKVDTWLERVGVTEYRRAYPSELPFGAQKKVSIARALSLEPKGFILDEPTTGLDRASAEALTDLVTELHRSLELTTVLISHDRNNILRTAERVVMIHEGRLIDAKIQRNAASDPQERPASIGLQVASGGDDSKLLRRFLALDAARGDASDLEPQRQG